MDTAIAGAICENADDFKPDYDMGQGILECVQKVMETREIERLGE